LILSLILAEDSCGERVRERERYIYRVADAAELIYRCCYYIYFVEDAWSAALMKKRKPVLIIDDSPASLKAIEILRKRNIEFVEYDIRKFAESCCGDLPTTKAPSVFTPEGLFKGLSGVEEYIASAAAAAAALAKKGTPSESESTYW
jgi:hypothetical protein